MRVECIHQHESQVYSRIVECAGGEAGLSLTSRSVHQRSVGAAYKFKCDAVW